MSAATKGKRESARDRRGRVGTVVVTSLVLVDLAVYAGFKARHPFGAIGLIAITGSGLLVTRELYLPLVHWPALQRTARAIRESRGRLIELLKLLLFSMMLVPVVILDFVPDRIRKWLIPVTVAAFFLAYTLVWAAYMWNIAAEALADDWVSRHFGRAIDRLSVWRRPLALWLLIIGLFLQYVEMFRA